MQLWLGARDVGSPFSALQWASDPDMMCVFSYCRGHDSTAPVFGLLAAAGLAARMRRQAEAGGPAAAAAAAAAGD